MSLSLVLQLMAIKVFQPFNQSSFIHSFSRVIGIFGGAHDEIIKFNFSHDSSQQTNNQFSSKITHHVSIPKVGINHVAIRKDSKIFATAGTTTDSQTIKEFRIVKFSFVGEKIILNFKFY